MRIVERKFLSLLLIALSVSCATWIFVYPAKSTSADLVWGVNGHPIAAYAGIPYQEQLDLVKQLGATHYRVDIGSVQAAGQLRQLIDLARAKGLVILPVLTPSLSLQKETPEDLYKKSRAFAADLASRFKDDIKVWELGNELENFAIIQPCEMQDNGVQYNCKWGAAGGVGPLDYAGSRWAKASAVLRGLSDGIVSVDPGLKKAIGTAGWGHTGAFERMQSDGIRWDISVWHFYGNDLEWGLKKVAQFGKPIWITEFNFPNGSKDGITKQASGILNMMLQFRDLKSKYKIEAAFIYELLDEGYWLPSYEAVMGLVYLDKKAGHWRPAGQKPAYCAVQSLLRGGGRLASTYQDASAVKSGGTADITSRIKRDCSLCFFDNKDGRPETLRRYASCLILGKEETGAGVPANSSPDFDFKAFLRKLMISPDFEARYSTASMSNADYITFLYRLILGREPDGQGLNDFMMLLNNGQKTRDRIFEDLIGSEEFSRIHSIANAAAAAGVSRK